MKDVGIFWPFLMIDLLLRNYVNVTLFFAIKKNDNLNVAVSLKKVHLWEIRTSVQKSSHLREIRIHSVKLSFCGDQPTQKGHSS